MNKGKRLETYFGLPSEVKFCKRCVISNQRPNSVVELKHSGVDKKPTTAIGQDGVCSACKFAEMKQKIDWVEREKQFRKLLDRYRRSDGYYDCIVPGSGGKDSCYVSHMLKYKYGMNPLTVTWAPHLYTDIGFRNMENWIRAGFDNILMTPNGRVHRLLTKLAFENLLHPFQPFIIGQKSIAPRISVLYNIPLIIYGENPVEYGNDLEDACSPLMSMKYYSGENNISEIILGGVSTERLIKDFSVSINDLNPYLSVGIKELQKVSTEVHFFSYYFNWDPQENYYYAVEKCGFEANTVRTEGSYSKYSSIDDKIDNFHYYTTYIKFGLGRASYDASQEIRTGKINREEGIGLVRQYDAEFPRKYFKEFLEYIDITEERFWEIVDKFRSPHLWKQEKGVWKLRRAVYYDE